MTRTCVISIYPLEEYKRDYLLLYVDTVRAVVAEEDPARPVLVSSPGNGLASEMEVHSTHYISITVHSTLHITFHITLQGYIASDPYSSLYGDTHYYNYREDNWDWRLYPRTRSLCEAHQ